MLLLSNANIHTLNPKQPHAEAIAIQTGPSGSGRVLGLGESEALRRKFGPQVGQEDMAGRTILPGLIDAHIHLRQYALNLDHINVGTATRKECLERVAARAEKSVPGAWIIGHGWRQNDWPEGFGSAALLDEAAPKNPVYLTAASLHAAWANSAAFKKAGIDANTPDPSNGRIQRDDMGQPGGILFESAMQLVAEAIPQATQQEITAAIKEAQRILWGMGLTGVHDFDRRRSFEALQSLHERDELRLRVIKHLPVESLDHAIAIGLHSGYGDDMLRIGGVKVFADGALGPRTAAMFEPYKDDADNKGMLFVDSEELITWARQAARGGLSMTVHAIGDRANHEVLNAFEQLRKFERNEGLPALRHRIEHVQILHPKDLTRLGDLNVGASMQPIHATSDMQAADQYWGERSKYAYAWRSQLEAGAVLAFGSDAPVESPDPFGGLHAAVTRRRVDGSPGPEGWYPAQRLNLSEGLAAFTQGPAFLAGMEDRLGRLAPGYLADLIVLEEDPFKVNVHDLHALQVQATMVGGEWVWPS